LLSRKPAGYLHDGDRIIEERRTARASGRGAIIRHV
jgi:hypothetical protein